MSGRVLYIMLYIAICSFRVLAVVSSGMAKYMGCKLKLLLGYKIFIYLIF